jgi:hypothetical protein
MKRMNITTIETKTAAVKRGDGFSSADSLSDSLQMPGRADL